MRNRLRRYMKEDFRILRPSLKEGKYIFVARVAANEATHAQLTAQMHKLIKRAELIKAEDDKNVAE